MPPSLDSFALEGSFLGVGKGIFCLERGYGRCGEGLCATLYLSSFVACRLQLLCCPAQSAYLYCACFRDEIAHIEIFSWSEGFERRIFRSAAGLQGWKFCLAIHCQDHLVWMQAWVPVRFWARRRGRRSLKNSSGWGSRQASALGAARWTRV